MKTRKKRWIVAGIIAGVVAVIFLVVVMCGKDYHSLDAEGLGKFIDQRENVWNQLIQEWEGESQDVWRYSPFKSAAERAVFSSSLLKRIRYDAQRNELTCYFSKTHHVTIWGEEELIYSPSHAIHDVGKTFAPYELNLTLAQEKEGFLRWEEGPRYFTVTEIRPNWYWIYRYWPN